MKKFFRGHRIMLLAILLVLGGIGASVMAARSLLLNCWFAPNGQSDSGAGDFLCTGSGHTVKFAIGAGFSAQPVMGNSSGIVTGPYALPSPSPSPGGICAPRNVIVTSPNAGGLHDLTHICCAYANSLQPVWKLGAACTDN